MICYCAGVTPKQPVLMGSRFTSDRHTATHIRYITCVAYLTSKASWLYRRSLFCRNSPSSRNSGKKHRNAEDTDFFQSNLLYNVSPFLSHVTAYFSMFFNHLQSILQFNYITYLYKSQRKVKKNSKIYGSGQGMSGAFLLIPEGDPLVHRRAEGVLALL